MVKAILALALLGVLGLAAAGCGATKKIVVQVSTKPSAFQVGVAYKGTITVVRTATIPNVKTGTHIKCKGWPALGRGVLVPAAGSRGEIVREVLNIAGEPPPPASSETVMRLRHLEKGSVTVSCTQSR